MTASFQVRQGDILLIKVDALPEAPARPSTRGNHLLALGETTGHAHYVRDLEGAMVEANDTMRTFARNEHGLLEARALVGGLRIGGAGATLWHGTPTADVVGPRDADHDPIGLPTGDYLVLCPREYDDSAEFVRVAD